MPDDVEIRLLRHYVAVAEELHFSRAAQRLYVAQQALSRDVRKLEDRVGRRLLERTTRKVALTPEGRLLLTRAREILALYDATMLDLRGRPRSLTVDVVGAGLTPALVLAAARAHAPGVEFFARFHSGTEAAPPLLADGRLDVTFGRSPEPPGPGGLGSGTLGSEALGPGTSGLGTPGLSASGPGAPGASASDHSASGYRASGRVRWRPVRHERIAVLLPERHPLARLPAIPLESLRGASPCIRAGDHATPGWEHAVLQLLAPFGVDAALAHPHVRGGDELAQHLRDRDAPILTLTTQPDIPGAVLRPLVDPVAMFPWTMIWRADDDHPGLRALHQAVDDLAAANDWLDVPDGAWFPGPEAGSGRQKA
ncbi:LysR family transcriptional regulator [Nonomuraea sp. NPDC001636]|uniref:LysR family transcriptional regulator n=1 Tax=Nonomuraea sp. NPDC001636 TaxID=3154391 RepID=UPI003331EABB